MHVDLQTGGAAPRRGGRVLYLEGLEEAPPSSPAGAVLHFVVVAAQAHHGLAVDVQLLVQGFQQGGTRALLNVPDTWYQFDRAEIVVMLLK